MGNNFFTLEARDGFARAGKLELTRGTLQTPAFMPVGTYGAVRALETNKLTTMGAGILLANTYHLMLRPGAERIAKLGGLHRFMNWDKPILTDSGGFQIMSLGEQVKIKKEGAQFRSHLDGALIDLSPERAMEVQALLGSDIHMVLDECLKLPADENQIKASVELSLNWAARSKAASSPNAKIFGIIQGGLLESQRIYSAQETIKLDFDGIAIGGLSVGETQEEMIRILDILSEHLPQSKPRYLMGVGRPDDILLGIARGVDMFDCVLPTREARHGKAWTAEGALNLRNATYAEDATPLAPGSPYSRAYLHHLFKIGEPLAMTLLTENNLTTYQNLMKSARTAIQQNNFAAFAESKLALYRKVV